MKIGILGAGHMGSAIIKGLANKYNPKDLYVKGGHITPSLQKFQKEVGFNLMDSNQALINSGIETLFVVTPAPITLDVLKTLEKDKLPSKVAIISAAGGVTSQDIKNILPNNPVICIIPNMPVAVNAGTLGTYVVPSDDKKIAKTNLDILHSLGDVIEVAEKYLGIIGVIGGCGPAFVDVFMAAMGDAAVENGVSRALAYKVIASMVKGSGQLAYDTNLTPADLKDQVTSPGGSTIEGVIALDQNNFRAAVIAAVNKANGKY